MKNRITENFSILLTDQGAPTEIVLWRAGINPSLKCPKKVYNKQSSESITAQWKTLGREIHFDYEHDTHNPQIPGHQKKAAGWGTVLATENECKIINIEWTKLGKESIESKEKRYLSGVFDLNSSNIIEALYDVALTNTPATLDPIPLKEDAISVPTKKTMTKGSTKMIVNELYDSLALAMEEAQEAAADGDKTVSDMGKLVAETLSPLISKMQEMTGYDKPMESLKTLKKTVREFSSVKSGLVGAVLSLISQAKLAKKYEKTEIERMVKEAIGAGKIDPQEQTKYEGYSRLDLQTFLETAPALHIKTAPIADKVVDIKKSAESETMDPEAKAFLDKVRLN